MAEYNMEILLQGREFDLVVKKLSGGGGGVGVKKPLGRAGKIRGKRKRKKRKLKERGGSGLGGKREGGGGGGGVFNEEAPLASLDVDGKMAFGRKL